MTTDRIYTETMETIVLAMQCAQIVLKNVSEDDIQRVVSTIAHSVGHIIYPTGHHTALQDNRWDNSRKLVMWARQTKELFQEINGE